MGSLFQPLSGVRRSKIPKNPFSIPKGMHYYVLPDLSVTFDVKETNFERRKECK